MATLPITQDVRTRVRRLRRAEIIYRTRGRFFVCEFIKLDGITRRMVARVGVHKHVTGKGRKFDPAEHGLITVWDARERDYRFIKLAQLTYFRCGDEQWGEECSTGAIHGELST